MASPEFVSAEYVYLQIQEITFPPRKERFNGQHQPFPNRQETVVPPEELPRFLTEKTLDTSGLQPGNLSGEVFFVASAVIKVKLSKDVVGQNRYRFNDDPDNDDIVETVYGNRMLISDGFVPTGVEGDITTFASLADLVAANEINPHTALVIKRIRAGGLNGTTVTRKLGHLVPAKPILDDRF